MAELNASQRNKLAQDAINVCKPANLSSTDVFTALKELNNPEVNALLEKNGISKEQLQSCGSELNALESATTAISGAKEKVSPKLEAPAAAPKVDSAAEREAKIKAAQTELAKAGFYGDAAKAKPESVADGKIGPKTALAMTKANDAVVKETANGKECPPALKGAAEALVSLKEIQGSSTTAKVAGKPLDIKPKAKPAQPKGQPRRQSRQEHSGGGDDDYVRAVSGESPAEIEAATRIIGRKWREEGPLGSPNLDPRSDPKKFAAEVKKVRTELNDVGSGGKKIGDVLTYLGRNQLFGTVPDQYVNGVAIAGADGRDDIHKIVTTHSITNEVGNHEVRDPKAKLPIRGGKNNFDATEPVLQSAREVSANGKTKIHLLGSGNVPDGSSITSASPNVSISTSSPSASPSGRGPCGGCSGGRGATG